MHDEPNVYAFKDTGLDTLCDTRDAFIQETLIRSAYGYKGMTPTEYWAKSVLHQTFDQPDDEFDRLSWQLLDDDEQAFTVVANHRGDGKTARTNAKITRGICMRLTPFILAIQAIQDDAVTEMDNVKAELAGNDFILDVFHVMKATSYDGIRKSYGRTAWFACNPDHPSIPKEKRGEPFCFILPRGATQRIRGRGININGKRIRPHWVFGDDIEDEETVQDEMQRKKLKMWWFGSVLPIVNQRAFPDAKTFRWKRPADAPYNWQPPWRIQLNGTILHQSSLICDLLADTSWKGVSIPLGHTEKVGDKVIYISDRPNRISSEQLTALAMTAKRQKALNTFYRERLCIPTARENACWTADLFQYMTVERDDELQTATDVIRFVIVDPSKSASQQADLTGILAVAIAPRLATIYIRRAIGMHLNSNDIPHHALNLAVETNSQMVFVEAIGQHGVVDVNFKQYIATRGVPVQLFLLDQGHTPRGDYGTAADAIKVWRGQQILPYYQEKQVIHHPDLRSANAGDDGNSMEQHMLDYPSPSDWCFIDCAGYIPAVMAELGIQFTKQERYSNMVQFAARKNAARMTQDIRKQRWAIRI